MALRYLLDENLKPAYKAQIVRREHSIVVRAVGELDAPPKGTPDPSILKWCEAHGYVLVTNNRKSMPGHLAEHLQAGGHMPGIFVLNPDMAMGDAIEILILFALASIEGEHLDRLVFLPTR